MAGEPTLARGMESADGWVEYLQNLLRHHDPAIDLRATGKFDDATYKAVVDFQHKNKIEPVDGVVGDATWSVLRAEPDRAGVGDSGTGMNYVEKGVELRFSPEAEHNVSAYGVDDACLLIAYSVGDTDPDLTKVHVVAHVRDPDGNSAEKPVQFRYFETDRQLAVIVGGVSGGKPGRYSILAQLTVDGEPGAEDSLQAEFDVHGFC
jgi:peptidoglycan hydrolase-like protein with peptidoglycan-binding domain